jgi:predicted ATP-binding protein involved in virulence
MFSKISIDGWRQFRHIDINFHPNGAGKTTILSLISRHLGWGVQYIGTPGRRRAGSSSLEYSADLWDFDSLQASNDENQSSGVTEASDGAHRQELSSADIETLTRILEERRQRGAAAIARRNKWNSARL